MSNATDRQPLTHRLAAHPIARRLVAQGQPPTLAEAGVPGARAVALRLPVVVARAA